MSQEQKEAGIFSIYKLWPVVFYFAFAVVAFAFTIIGITAIGGLAVASKSMLCQVRNFGAETMFWFGDQLGKSLYYIFLQTW